MDSLPNKEVKVVPVVRNGRSHLPKGHDGEFMFTGCKAGFVVPFDVKRGQLINPLTDEERVYLEKALSMKEGDLSIYKKDKENFWKSFRVYLDKEKKVLKLSDPMDYISYKVLLVVPQVAPSWEKRFDSGEYRFALVEAGYEVREQAKAADVRRKAYAYFNEIEGDRERMIDVLTVYGKKPSAGADKDFLVAAIDAIISNPSTVEKFLTIVTDKHFEKKLFIEKCLEAGALTRNRTKYVLPGGDTIGNNIDEAIEYISNKKNSEIYATLKAQIEAFKH